MEKTHQVKKIILLLFLSNIVLSCKNKNANNAKTEELSVTHKIANAHGLKNWDKVTTFEFRFGGKKEDTNSGRFWTWNPKTDDIKLTSNSDTISYNRKQMDSTAIKADRRFINDKFWALIPFQLVWDEGTTISESEKAISPVKQQELNKITIVYSSNGGYTPGDAYDIFFGEDHIIREWIYRKGNQPEPSLSNTFENYQDFNGLKIALEHKRTKDDWNLLIRNVKVTTKH